MNELNEIILSINKVEEEDKNAKDINFTDENKKKYEMPEALSEWIIVLKEKLSKCGYKKVIKDIDSRNLINNFSRTPYGYKIIILYIQAKCKVIENKILKYHLNHIESNKQKTQISHCLSYASNIEFYLKIILDNISETNKYDNKYYYDINKRNYKIELFDDIIRCHFDYIYTMAFFHYKIGNVMEAISYLSLFLSLYKETKLIILSCHTLYKVEKCFILLSRIYIFNEDYTNALLVLNHGMKVCFKQIVFQVQELYYGVFVGEKTDLLIREKEDLLLLKDSRIKRIIVNIIIIFFYQGICNEHLSNIKKATAFYKQCEWFSRIFIEKDNELFYRLFRRLKRNCIEVCNNIDFFNEKIQEYELKLWNKKKDENNKKKKNKKYAMQKLKLFNEGKFNGLIEKLEGLKIKEINTVNKFEKNKCIKTLNSRREAIDKNLYLSNIRLLEAYLRNDFKDIVNKMDKIHIFDFDYRTRTVVQKTINKFFFEKNQQSIRDKSKSSFYRPEKKSVTIRTPKDENEEINKGLYNKEYAIFDSYSDSRNNHNRRNKINTNFTKIFLSEKNSMKILQSKQEKENFNNTRIRNKEKLFLSSKDLITPNYKRIQYSASSSFLLNSSRHPKSFKKSLSLSKDVREIQKENQNNKINKKDKYKSLSLTKINNSFKYRLIHPENQKIKEFFNFKYLQKRNYIKKLTDRELLFQKSILKSKNTPRLSFQFFNKVMAQKNADYTFNKIESLVSNRIGNSDWKENLSEDEYREHLIKNKLEKMLLTSLDNKALVKYKMNLKRIEKMEDEKELLEDSSKYDRRLLNIDNINKNVLNELNLKLNQIYENELKRDQEMKEHKNEINRNIFKKFRRNKSSLSRSLLKDRSDRKLGKSQSYSNMTKINLNKCHCHI